MKAVILLFTLFFTCILLGCSDPCSDVTCQNAGTCFEGSCQCATGWTGTNCETSLCDVLDCQNGATCLLGDCQCPPGYYGEECELSFQGRLIGNWTANQSCTYANGNVDNDQYVLAITAGGNNLEANLAFNVGFATADLINPHEFEIPYQQRPMGSYEGDGFFVNDSTISITFNYSSGGLRQCSLTAVRQ